MRITSAPRSITAFLMLVGILILLAILYAPTFLTQINGSSDPYMIDVGEVQTALNVWGTIHATGYPLYVMLGSAGTAILRALGANPAVAPCLFSLVIGFLALSLFYALILRLTGRITIAAVTTLLLGVTRTVWVYNVVAKEYSLNTLFEIGLLAIALWPPPLTAANGRRRVWLLALIGGFGVAHHRTVIFMAPGLLWAVWPGLRTEARRALVTIGGALLIGLLGFLPYIYLPARALAHGDFVYGDPGTVPGFLDQFLGREASHLSHLPATPDAWLHDIQDTFAILVTELTPILAVMCLIGTIAALSRSRFRREARITALCAPIFLLFLFAFHQVVMPQAVAMPVVMFLIVELALSLGDLGGRWQDVRVRLSTRAIPDIPVAIGAAGLILAVIMVAAQRPFIDGLTHDDTGLQMIALAKSTPRDHAVFMLSWGPRFHAVAFSKYVTGENADLAIVTHTADFRTLSAQNTIYTSKDTFYDFPAAWWEAQIGHVYLSAPRADLVAIQTRPADLTGSTVPDPVGHHIGLVDYHIACTADTIDLAVRWAALARPDADLSVFVHLLGPSNPVPIAQDDRSSPVYGLYRTTAWTSGEVIPDHYTLPRLPDADRVTFGMYDQPSPGKFENFGTQTIRLSSIGCDGH
ncbi:MAG TPA: DUF2723 domain-containing protein [Aggregatilineales bacterium]|nr:DUF2723 domain-containing protein [Aggregatilineales bacterium]